MPENVGELPIDTRASALEMAEEIFGDGVTVESATYYGDNRSSGVYSDGDAVSPTLTPADSGVILSTGRAGDITNNSGQTNQAANTSTNSRGVDNWDKLNDHAGARTYDASALEIVFTPDSDTLTMQFVFASEEYPEFTDSVYQDTVYVSINGTVVPLSVGDGDTNPENINSGTNENLFLDNANDDYNTEMDGFTVTMTMTIPVNVGVENTLLIAIADVGDNGYDSNLLIAGDSLQTALVAEDDSATLNGDGTRTIDVLENDETTGSGTLTITHIDGVPVVVGQIVTLPTGQTVVLNADATLTMVGDGTSEDFNYTYSVTDGANTDTAFVQVTVPCFVRDTMIHTPNGEVAVQDLCVGDLVETQDDGPQPIRWTGCRTVPARGKMAPVRIEANTFGRHRALLVSPLHRILIKDALSEILFGEPEVLVTARDLVNDRSVTIQSGGEVEYHHILFDRHQIVFSQGLASESFLPGSRLVSLLEEEIVDEICEIFPELDPKTGEGYSPSARRTLKKYEANLLRTASGEAA